MTASPTTQVIARPLQPLILSSGPYLIRPLRSEDAKDVHRLANDWEVVRMLTNIPFPYPRGLAENWIEGTLRQAEAGIAWHFAIEGDGVLLGCIGVSYEKLRKAARIGYWVGRPYWGRGIATHAANAVIDWSFQNLNINRIYAEVAEDNAGSIALLKRIDFVHKGTEMRHLAARGRSQRVSIYEFERAQWNAQEATPMHSPETSMRVETKNLPPLSTGETPLPTLLIVVAVALLDHQQRILLATRPQGKSMAGLWEFPGGKVEDGETPEHALQRELKEELGIVIDTDCLSPFTFASHPIDGRHLLMPLYLCRKWSGTPTPREGQKLAWVEPEALTDFAMPPADAPLIPMLTAFLNP